MALPGLATSDRCLAVGSLVVKVLGGVLGAFQADELLARYAEVRRRRPRSRSKARAGGVTPRGKLHYAQRERSQVEIGSLVVDRIADTYIAFLVTGDAYHKSGIKPAAEIAGAYRRLGGRISVLGVDVSAGANADLLARFGGDYVEIRPEHRRESDRLAQQVLQRLRPTHVFVEDRPRWLTLLARTRKGTPTKEVVYGLSFRGLRFLWPFPSSPFMGRGEQLVNSSAWLTPFGVRTATYRRQILEADAFVAISRYSELLAWTLYGVRSAGVVFPPIPEALIPPPSGPRKAREGILVYLGNKNDRNPRDYIDVLRTLAEQGVTIYLFGDPDISSYVQRKEGLSRTIRLTNVTDEALAEAYRSVCCTYLTTLWEGFGYVGPESLLNDTPVVCEMSQPWMELIDAPDMIKIARSKTQVVDYLKGFSQVETSLSPALQDELRSKLAPDFAAKSLYTILP